MKTNASRILGAIVALAVGLPLAPAAWAQQVAPSMLVSQQNALVQKHCAVCHSDAKMMGGLSLERFDAAHPDPTVAGMMVDKLNNGAMGAAGIPIPDTSIINALTAALSSEAADAATATGGWTFKAFNDPVSKAPLVTATIVREVNESSAYQLTVTCQKTADLAKGGNAGAPAGMHITTYKKESGGLWPRPMSALSLESVPLTYELDGTARTGALRLTEQNSGTPTSEVALPAKMLTVRNLFPGEAVVFPFGGLNETLRRVLSTCVGNK